MALIVIDDRILNYQVENVKDSLERITNQIFKLPQGEEGNDLFKMIISAIQDIYNTEKIPILIRVGALNGTDI